MTGFCYIFLAQKVVSFKNLINAVLNSTVIVVVIDPEECSCTFQAFTDSPNSYQYMKDLGDLLDPNEHYGHEKSWAGFTIGVLQMEPFRIPAIEYET
jgi:hypothetical protein